MEVIIPGPFAQLITDPNELRIVEEGFERTILRSFEQDARSTGATPNITQREIRRRFQICEKWFRACRAELHWSVQRTVEQLPMMLRAELNGNPIDPSKLGQVWHVEGGERDLVYDKEGPDYTDPEDNNG